MNTYIIVTLIAPFFDRCHIYVISVYLPLYLSTYLPTYLPVFIYLFYLSTHLSYLSTHLIYLSLSVYLSYLSIYIVYLPIYLLIVVVQSLNRVWLFVTPWTATHQASLSFTISQSLFKLISFESVMPSNHLILCHPLLLLPSIFPSIRVFFSESAKTLGKLLELQLQHQSYLPYLSFYLPILSTHLPIYLPTYLHTFFVYQYHYFSLDSSTDSMTLHPLILQGANPKSILFLHNYDAVFTLEKFNIDTSLSNI